MRADAQSARELTNSQEDLMSWSLRGALIALAISVAACAKPVRDIEPASVDASAFAGVTCPELTAKKAKLSQALIFRGFAQDQTSVDDRAGVLGVPLLMGTMFDGDNETGIARLKGELRALDSQMLAMNCSLNNWW
jgi:hypothetical protein